MVEYVLGLMGRSRMRGVNGGRANNSGMNIGRGREKGGIEHGHEGLCRVSVGRVLGRSNG
jgi:hypothetical protein